MSTFLHRVPIGEIVLPFFSIYKMLLHRNAQEQSKLNFFYHGFACCSFLCLYTWLEWDLYKNKSHVLFITKCFMSGAMPRTLYSTFH